MSAGASGFPSGESMNRGQIGPGADARRPRVGPSTVRATSHRHRIGKRMPCGTVRAMQPDSTRAGDTDRRPPSGESHVAGCPPRGCRDVCPPCVPRDCPPRLCPHNRPRAARPAAHAVTWPGLDRGRWEDAERKKRRLPRPGSPPAPDCPSTLVLPLSNQIKPLLRGNEGKPREGDLAGLG